MQSIVTLGQINEALKITSVTAAQLAEMGFAALENKPICEALPPEESRRLRNARLYQADSIPQIRTALAKHLAAPATCLHQIQEPAPVLVEQSTEVIAGLWEAIGHHSAQVADTGEMAPGQKLLDAARAVELAIRPPAIASLSKGDYLEGVNIPNLREALIFLGRENGVGEGEVGDKLAQYVNSVVSGVLCKKATLRAAPAASEQDALPLAAYLCIEESGVIDFEVIPPCTLPPGEYSLYAKSRTAQVAQQGGAA